MSDDDEVALTVMSWSLFAVPESSGRRHVYSRCFMPDLFNLGI